MNDVKTDEQLRQMMFEILEELHRAKPEERSEKARRYAVTITELEKVYSYFKTFVTDMY